jgi:hypothetical protein
MSLIDDAIAKQHKALGRGVARVSLGPAPRATGLWLLCSPCS